MDNKSTPKWWRYKRNENKTHRREEHVAVLVADDGFQNIELSTPAVPTHSSTVTSVLGGSQNLFEAIFCLGD